VNRPEYVSEGCWWAYCGGATIRIQINISGPFAILRFEDKQMPGTEWRPVRVRLWDDHAEELDARLLSDEPF